MFRRTVRNSGKDILGSTSQSKRRAGAVSRQPRRRRSRHLRLESLEQRMGIARTITTLVLLLRNKSHLNVRQPLSRILLIVGGGVERKDPTSNFGPEIDVSSQGTNAPSLNASGGEQTFGGTSAAAPTVAAEDPAPGSQSPWLQFGFTLLFVLAMARGVALVHG